MKFTKTVLLKFGVAFVILVAGVALMQFFASSKTEPNKREVKAPVRKVETFIPEFSDIPFIVDGNALISL